MARKWCLVYLLLVFASIFQFVRGAVVDDKNKENEIVFTKKTVLIIGVFGTFGVLMFGIPLCCWLAKKCSKRRAKRRARVLRQQGKK